MKVKMPAMLFDGPLPKRTILETRDGNRTMAMPNRHFEDGLPAYLQVTTNFAGTSEARPKVASTVSVWFSNVLKSRLPL